MTYSAMQTIWQLTAALGLVLTGLGGYGAFWCQRKIDAEKRIAPRPTIDLCHRGITVKELEGKAVHFDIPYCSGRNANAFNVKLRPGVAIRDGGEVRVLLKFKDDFPDGVVLTYETGKAMAFNLAPLDARAISSMYICVQGSFTDESGRSVYPVFDVFKFDDTSKEWVRAIGSEYEHVRIVVSQ